MTTTRLVPHPSSYLENIHTLKVATEIKEGRLALSYQLRAVIPKLQIPASAQSVRADNLWKHSCFEVFLLTDNGPAYQEYNFSPSGAWAHYVFNEYRQATAAETEIHAPVIKTQTELSYFELNTIVPLDNSIHYIGLSAVIEDLQGRLSYWALRHPADQPDFHHPDAFTLKLE